MGFTEANFENSVVELFETLGYDHVYGPDNERDLHNPFIEEQLRSSLETINPTVPKVAIDRKSVV